MGKGSSTPVTGHADHRREPVWSQELATGTGGKGLWPPAAVSAAVLRKPRSCSSQHGPGCLRLRGPLVAWTPGPGQEAGGGPPAPHSDTPPLCSRPGFCALHL